MNHLQPPKNGVTIMKCNPDKYREHIASFEMTREQEDELLFALWHIMKLFAELGHGVNSINNIFPNIFEKTDQE